MVTADAFHDWNLPERIARLKDLAYNLWWSWHPEARALFKEMDRTLWAETHHNPVRLLRACPKDRLDALQAEGGSLPDCGHFIPEEKPRELAARLRMFLEK